MKSLPLRIGSYIIKLPLQSGGKAGKGKNKTSTIQVLNSRSNFLVKEFRYKTDDFASKLKAIDKAENFAKTHIPLSVSVQNGKISEHE